MITLCWGQETQNSKAKGNPKRASVSENSLCYSNCVMMHLCLSIYLNLCLSVCHLSIYHGFCKPICNKLAGISRGDNSLPLGPKAILRYPLQYGRCLSRSIFIKQLFPLFVGLSEGKCRAPPLAFSLPVRCSKWLNDRPKLPEKFHVWDCISEV
jgi:hypothetical protein